MQPRLRHLPFLLLGLGFAFHGAPCNADDASTGTAIPDAAAAGAAPQAGSAGTQAPALFRALSGSLDGTVASRYLFQGIDYSDGRSVLQPNVVVSHGAFAAVLWANYQPNLGDVNEIDASLKITKAFGRLTVSPGYTYLRYPNRVDWAPSQELYADLSVVSPLSPTLSVHQDIDAGDGTYATLGVSQTVAASFTLASNLFYQHHYYEMTGVPAVELKAGTSFPYGGMTLAPAVSYMATSHNGDFRGGAHIPAGWLVAVNVSPK